MTGREIAWRIRWLWWKQTVIEWLVNGVPWSEASDVAADVIMAAYVEAGFPKIVSDIEREKEKHRG